MKLICLNLRKIKLFLCLFLFLFSFNISAKENSDWYGNIEPITKQDWDINKATHLLERAGFGGTPEEIKFLFNLGLSKAIEHLVY